MVVRASHSVQSLSTCTVRTTSSADCRAPAQRQRLLACACVVYGGAGMVGQGVSSRQACVIIRVAYVTTQVLYCAWASGRSALRSSTGPQQHCASAGRSLPGAGWQPFWCCASLLITHTPITWPQVALRHILTAAALTAAAATLLQGQDWHLLRLLRGFALCCSAGLAP